MAGTAAAATGGWGGGRGGEDGGVSESAERVGWVMCVCVRVRVCVWVRVCVCVRAARARERDCVRVVRVGWARGGTCLPSMVVVVVCVCVCVCVCVATCLPSMVGTVMTTPLVACRAARHGHAARDKPVTRAKLGHDPLGRLPSHPSALTHP